MSEFKLSASLKGHEDDVRAVVFPSPNTILSASRDGTVRRWVLTSSKPATYDDTIAVQSSSFINSLAYVHPSKQYPQGLIASGGKDTIIDVRQPGSSPDQNAERLLLGHAHNVCTLDATQDGRGVISGGWDTQARSWDLERGETVAEFKGHEASVWAVLALDADHVITGCADKHIRIYHPSGKLLHDIPGLPDVVRALCRLPPGHPSGAAFASAGNDQVIRFWTIDGLEVAQLHGHEAFIYALAVLPDGDLVSSSEDRTVRIWRNTECIQTITHPAISVWTVAVCKENGDIVTGASDKMVRVFSRSSERQADEESLRAFGDSVKGSTIPQQTAGDGQKINKETLPGSDFLQQRSGTKEGQVQMIREDNGNVAAYTWSTAAQQWINVGTVVDSAASSGRKVTYQGQDYDYVFDVDIEDGKPPLKLPYNSSQNPYEAAQHFIANNELPITYVDQVANFIMTNTQGANLGAPAQPSQGGSDPWGTENRYRPGEVGAPEPASDTRPRALPQTQYLSITTANLPAIRKKIGELNESANPDVALSADDLKLLDQLVKQLQTSPKDPKPQSNQISVILRTVTQWPPANRLPGIDILRLSAVAPSFATHTSTGDGTIIDTLATADIFNPSTDRPNNTMLAVRVLANMFVTDMGRTVTDGCFDQILDLISPFLTSNNKNLSAAIATLHINFAVLISSSAPAAEATMREVRAIKVFKQAIAVLSSQERGGESETIYRGLVALGTLLALGSDFRKKASQSSEVEGLIGRIEKGPLGKETRIKVLIGEMRDQLT